MSTRQAIGAFLGLAVCGAALFQNGSVGEVRAALLHSTSHTLELADGGSLDLPKLPKLQNSLAQEAAGQSFKLVYVRHGQSTWNAKDEKPPPWECEGITSKPDDCTLTKKGVKDALDAGATLKAAYPDMSDQNTVLVHSNLDRAQLTGVLMGTVIAPGEIWSSVMMDALQETSIGPDAGVTLKKGTCRTQTKAVRDVPDDLVELVGANYANTNCAWNTGGYNMVNRKRASYIAKAPKLFAKLNTLVGGDQKDRLSWPKIVVAGHSHWWNEFVKNSENGAGGCETLGEDPEKLKKGPTSHLANGQAVEITLTVGKQPTGMLSSKSDNTYSITACRTLPRETYVAEAAAQEDVAANEADVAPEDAAANKADAAPAANEADAAPAEADAAPAEAEGAGGAATEEAY